MQAARVLDWMGSKSRAERAGLISLAGESWACMCGMQKVSLLLINDETPIESRVSRGRPPEASNELASN